ncbi:thiol-disulfide isomerase [Candidatus Parcubacteria bacterium]|nr:MAG: thiol-disulfide isomerase [Candidatus Parcubacteria bacterium]
MKIEARKTILWVVIVIIGGTIIFLQSQKASRVGRQDAGSVVPGVVLSKTEKAKRYEPAKEITTPDGFINIDEISIADQVGKKVVLVDFWTYSCINCQRTIPYLNAWHEKYSDKGLVIIGVHTPEFEFEEKYENVQRAVQKFAIKYPIVLDNDYSTWTAYKNRYWPRKYLIDIDGFIIYDHIGEGAYEETERKIQEALAERAKVLGEQASIAGDISKPAGVDENILVQSPEVYFGALRNEYLGNGQRGSVGIQKLSQPKETKLNTLYLVGDWDVAEEFAQNTSAQSKIIFKYKAQDVYFVASSENGVLVRVLIDGKPVGSVAGQDVVQDGTVFIKEEGLYRLIEDSSGLGEHTLEIIIEDPGLKAFTFTFG